jgi:hypothetical protein
MPYSFDWVVQGRVVLEKAFGDVTIEELVRFNAEVTTLIAEQGIAPVHVIVDLTNVGKYPSSLKDIMSTMRQRVPDKVGWMLVVTQNPIMRFVASIIFQLARLRVRMFQTIQEALDFLKENDDSLPPDNLQIKDETSEAKTGS